jgi:hypothetical protein
LTALVESLKKEIDELNVIVQGLKLPYWITPVPLSDPPYKLSSNNNNFSMDSIAKQNAIPVITISDSDTDGEFLVVKVEDFYCHESLLDSVPGIQPNSRSSNQGTSHTEVPGFIVNNQPYQFCFEDAIVHDLFDRKVPTKTLVEENFESTEAFSQFRRSQSPGREGESRRSSNNSLPGIISESISGAPIGSYFFRHSVFNAARRTITSRFIKSLLREFDPNTVKPRRSGLK